MSPEQVRSAKNIDVRADVWSLGVILYCLLVGVPPFHGPSLGALVYSVVRGPIPDVRALRPDVPAGVALVIARCLERDRSKRVRDCFELALLLAPYVRPDGKSAERIAVLDYAVARVPHAARQHLAAPPGPAAAEPPRAPEVMTVDRKQVMLGATLLVIGTAVIAALTTLAIRWLAP
jgi:serine/threonine-protein kinase